MDVIVQQCKSTNDLHRVHYHQIRVISLSGQCPEITDHTATYRVLLMQQIISTVAQIDKFHPSSWNRPSMFLLDNAAQTGCISQQTSRYTSVSKYTHAKDDSQHIRVTSLYTQLQNTKFVHCITGFNFINNDNHGNSSQP